MAAYHSQMAIPLLPVLPSGLLRGTLAVLHRKKGSEDQEHHKFCDAHSLIQERAVHGRKREPHTLVYPPRNPARI